MSWFTEWTGLLLRDPSWLWLGILLPLLIGWRSRSERPALRFAPAEFTNDLPRTARQRLLWLPGALQVAGLGLALLALARPVQRVLLPREFEALDVLLVLDVSSSMTATDMDPKLTRLEVAREAAAEFVAGSREDRIGLLTFARYPDLRCPPTSDHRALTGLLASVTLVERDGPEDATGIGTALARAGQVLRGSPAAGKVVILLTDGAENVATAQTPGEIAPLHAAQLCRQLGIRTYTIVAGVGERTPGGALLPLDTREVEQVATTTDGAFFSARDAGAVARVFAEIAGLERSRLATPRVRLEDRFAPFLLAALGCGLIAWLLRVTWLRVLP